MVVGYADDMTAVAMGKGGQRNLHTGEVVGVDPVAPYAKAEGPGMGTLETRVWQLQRVMDFPRRRLWLISTVYPMAPWRRWKELVGNHGGWAASRPMPSYSIRATWLWRRRGIDRRLPHLNNHRGKPVAEKPPVAAANRVADWAPKNLLKGLGQVGGMGGQRRWAASRLTARLSRTW